MLGLCKWYKTDKAYGFLSPDGSNKDVFVHISALQESGIESLKAGDRVEFQTRPGKKGDEAFDIKILK